MGLFSSKKTLTVSSVVYNLAGDVLDRPDYLKTTVIGSVVGRDPKRNLSNDITQSYIKGPGIRLRSFGRWARTRGYNSLVGMAPGTLSLLGSLDQEALAAAIPKAPSQVLDLQRAEIGVPDYSYWVDRYMVLNHPTELDTEYTADFDEGSGIITLTRAGGAIETFLADGFNPSGAYLYATYRLTEDGELGPVVPGTEVTLDEGDPYPSLTGWTEVSSVTTPQTVTLTTETTVQSTYSDGRPIETDTSSSSTTEDYDEIEEHWTREDYQGVETTTGSAVARSWALISTQERNQVGEVYETTTVNVVVTDIGGGVTRTTTTTVVEENLRLVRTYRIDTQERTITNWGPMQVLIYQRGTGNALYDALFTTSGSVGDILPFIPLRLNNVFVSGSDYADLYAPSRRAMRRALNTSFNKIIRRLEENPQLGDIDYAYVMFGVALNVRDNASRRYVYEFFQEVMLGQTLGSSAYDAWRTAWLDAQSKQVTWSNWFSGQGDPDSPYFGEPEPERGVFPQIPSFSFQHASAGRGDINYNITVSWNAIDETVGSGKRKPDAKAGELWFETLGEEVFEQTLIVETLSDDSVPGFGLQTVTMPVRKIRLNWQVDDDTWRSLDIYGLKHRNLIYGGKAVEIEASAALAEAEESGFIIPIHEGVLNRMPLTEATQVATACCFMVLNTYQIRRRRWYQSSWFKVLLIVAIVVVAVATGGIGASGAGLLGTNAAIGASLGFTGTTAVLAGAIANAVVAMVVTQMISVVSSAVFDPKIAAIVTAIASFVAIQAGTSFMSGAGFSSMFGDMFRAENILRFTLSVGDGATNYIQAEAQDVMNKTQRLINEYTAQSRELSRQYEAMFGGGNAALNPMMFTDSPHHHQVFEPSTSFLERTLMTGSDVAETSLRMVSDFAELTLSPVLPTREPT